VKLNRKGLTAGLLASAAVAMLLSACSSSGSDEPAGTDSSTTSSTPGSTEPTSSSAPAEAACFSGNLTGEGSSAQKNAMETWISDYQDQCSGASIAYNPSGSGAGVTNFTGGQVNFAGSDSALNADKGEVAAAEKTCGSPALDLPMVTGPIALAYNLPGIDDLTLTPEVAFKIFNGDITKWNDPAIAAINSGVDLPSTDIKVFVRSDESGTTNNVEKYFAATVPSLFTTEPDKAWNLKAGEGKKGSDGVQQGIGGVEGGFGYVEWSFALDADLGVAKIDNGGGAVELTGDTVAKAVSTAKIVGTGDDLSLKLDYATKEAGAYPLILVTYEIVCSKYSDPKVGTAVKSFLTYAAGAGQDALADLGYAKLPADLLTKVNASVAKIS
jgi:phosphate transport system substrate-binding protein